MLFLKQCVKSAFKDNMCLYEVGHVLGILQRNDSFGKPTNLLYFEIWTDIEPV